MRRVYLEFYSLVVKCMELSFNSIARLISELNSKYHFDGDCELKDDLLELYPLSWTSLFFLDCTVSPSAHYQSVLKDSRPKSQRLGSTAYQRHLSDDADDCSTLAPLATATFQPFNEQSLCPCDSCTTSHVSSSTIAFAKTQTLTLAEADKYHASENVPLLHTESSDINPYTSSSVSVVPYPDILTENNQKKSHPEPERFGYSPLKECECYPDYNDFEDDDDESEYSDEAPVRASSSTKLQSLLGGVPLHTSSEYDGLVPPQQEEVKCSDIVQLKKNLATRLCFNITACSCQIWVIHSTFTSLIAQNIAVITRALNLKAIEKLREQVKTVNSVVTKSLQEIEGRVVVVCIHEL